MERALRAGTGAYHEVERRIHEPAIMTDSPDPHQTPHDWDAQAAAFDDEPDHGLRDPSVREAWREQLRQWLPPGRTAVLDAGCGTGSLSLLVAETGHLVTGIDWSVAMLARARAKAEAAGLSIDFRIGDAAAPHFPPRSFDVVLCRHVLWALPEPVRVLQRWAGLLSPGGRLVLIEGYWNTGGGLHAGELVRLIPPSFANFQSARLSDDPRLWGGPVTDERYVILARKRARPTVSQAES